MCVQCSETIFKSKAAEKSYVIGVPSGMLNGLGV